MRGADSPPEAAGARLGTPARLAHLYRAHVVGARREQRLLVALSFLCTIAVVRFITHSIRDRRFTWLFHNIGSGEGTHLHHLVFGIAGLLVVGYVSTAFEPNRRWVCNLLALLFGLSAALTLDEFALWLKLRDVYWTSEGRDSVDVFVAVAGILGVAAAGRGLFVEMGKDVVAIVRGSPNR